MSIKFGEILQNEIYKIFVVDGNFTPDFADCVGIILDSHEISTFFIQHTLMQNNYVYKFGEGDYMMHECMHE